MFIPYRSVYNYILGKPFAEALDTMVSPIHLKVKYQYMHDEIMIIIISLFGAKRIYKAL